MPTQIFGVDLAWGEKKPDGLAWITASRDGAQVQESGLTHGDAALVDWVMQRVGQRDRALVMVDAPLVIPNRTGARPVDKLTHVLFRQQHAGCHPAYLEKCPRPPRVAALFEEEGLTVGWDLKAAKKLVAEVYPHPAMVRLFGLDRIIKYKRGRVEEKRAEFARLQRLLRKCLKQDFPHLQLDAATKKLLRQTWTKPIEDETDGLFCALIGLWHWQHQSKQTQVLGDLATGFILVPQRPNQV